MDVVAVWLMDLVFFLSAVLQYVLYVSHKLISSCWILAFLYSMQFVYTLFLSQQTGHRRNIVSFYFFLFTSGRAYCLSRDQCVGWRYVTVAALCSSCSLQKCLGRWPAALNEAGLSMLMLMKGSKILRVELNTVHCNNMHSKLQHTWRGDYCQCVQPAQLIASVCSLPNLLPICAACPTYCQCVQPAQLIASVCSLRNLLPVCAACPPYCQCVQPGQLIASVCGLPNSPS
jgi:hypothetical protein